MESIAFSIAFLTTFIIMFVILMRLYEKQIETNKALTLMLIGEKDKGERLFTPPEKTELIEEAAEEDRLMSLEDVDARLLRSAEIVRE